MSSTLERLSPWLFTIAMFVLWELVCRIFKVDTFVLPAPSQIFQAIGQYWLPLGKNAFVTLWTTLAGFALAVAFGIVLGIIVGWSRTIYRGLYPVMIGFNSIPKVAVVPILIIWFGIGIVPAVLTAFLISFFPIVVNVATGLAPMEPELEDVLRGLGAKKLDIMLKVGIPRTQPYLFGSLKIAITLAFVGERDGDLERTEQIGLGARNPDLEHDVELLGAERAQHVLELRLHGGEPGCHIHHDRKERDQKGGQHRRHDADAEPDDQDRHHRHLRDRVEADHHGIEAAIDRARPADDDAEHNAKCDGKGKTRERRPQRDEGVLAERQPVLADGLKYLRGRGQHEGVDLENAAHQLPEHEHGDGEQPGR